MGMQKNLKGDSLGLLHQRQNMNGSDSTVLTGPYELSLLTVTLKR